MTKQKKFNLEEWARVGDEVQAQAYEDKRAHGCCGSFNKVVTAPDGNKYMVGCNYGY